MNTAERLRKALELRGMTQTELSEITGLNKGSISCYLSGRYSPKQRAIFKMAEALDVSELYLMWLTDSPEKRKSTSGVQTPEVDIDAVTAEIVDLIQQMTDDQRLSLLQFVRSLTAHN